MKRLAGLTLTAMTLSAQWLNYPTPGIPRTPDGKPNLTAPAPRAPDGKPDLSGIWQPEDNRPCPPSGCTDMKVPQEFVNIGWGIKGGLPYQPWAAELVKARMARNGMDDPTSHCLPGGPVKGHTERLFRKTVQAPGLLLILSERNVSYRQIFLDGRPLPKDPNPSFSGYSSGRWDGDTLVVHTNGLQDGLWLDRSGSPLTDASKLTERFHRLTLGKMEVEMTVDDPKAYTAPWTVRVTELLAPDTEILEYQCLENERDGAHLVGK